MVRFLKLLVLVPAGIVILAFSIANRTAVTVSFDPFSAPDLPAAAVSLPLYAVLFITLIAGIVLGGVAAWLAQGVNRRKARRARDDAERWQEEASLLREKVPLTGLTSRALVR